MFSLYMIVVTLGFITGVSMETCPEAEDIYPCRCKEDEYGYITVKCSSDLFNNLENRLQLKLLQQALSSLKGKNCRLLILTDFTIRIPSNFFAGLSIYYLEVDSCRVDFLTNDDQPELLGLENHLVVLEFKGSSTVPPKLNLGHLKKLRELKLYRNNIPELRDDWLSSGPSSLRYLYIQGNNITKIGSNAFSKLSNLERLWLDDNRFGEIRRSLFPTTADRLDALSLDNNGLTSLPVDLFSGMPSITALFLSKNGLTTLDERTWSPIWQQLDYVYLEGNNIVCDNRLNWILKSKKRPRFFRGECNAPKEFEGRKLDEFYRSPGQTFSEIFT